MRRKMLITASFLCLGVVASAWYVERTAAYLELEPHNLLLPKYPEMAYDSEVSEEYLRYTKRWGWETRIENLFGKRTRFGAFTIKRDSDEHLEPDAFQQKVANFYREMEVCDRQAAIGKGGGIYLDCRHGTRAVRLGVLHHKSCCGSVFERHIVSTRPDDLIVYVYQDS